ncbi:BNR/Asp-box repeat-containing protein [Aquiflexum balticum DSM 16537]|uniref:BNR/Asp-box repeat-containing protein n=1 Tax=Aquiflexum balticum DSM 16537 TaxID=758820 RepID=A0A1W2H2A4_9BACT|nr:sialidase family protein [Aquiflexum balticum]SMD43043.1 BNR/Asp-box repeat-containing protein [Aquiflexum balticum DSM 16537]
MKNTIRLILVIGLLFSFGFQMEGWSQTYNEKIYDAVQWRLVGPHRGGRSATVAGVASERNTFYFGATGGGVWKTTDGGKTWGNISDGFFGGSIGAVAVADSDPNIIYVGGGEKTVRGNVSYGYGMWKSTDAGKTWEHLGMEESRFISRIRIHPSNPDIVYAAIMGDIFKPTEMRGVYKSSDGGKTWDRKLFASQVAGAVDLILDPNNPNILYATTWDIKRTPYSLESGGPNSKMFKSTDGGENWKEISRNKGLPEGTLGIMGITVSPLNSNRLWAIVENLNGGVFRSDDGGETWEKTNEDRNLRQRAWYYSRIYADTQSDSTVYVMNVSYHKSTDGGKTFKSSNAPHGDHHDLWIDPKDNQRMIIADDGGAQVSFDGGESWSTYMNQPTAQFYRVTTDNHFPYRIYGAQQDNSTMRINHRNEGYGITENDWEVSAGSESGWLAVDPTDNDVVYGGNYGGLLQMLNHRTGAKRNVNVYPDNPMGHGAEGMKYRFQWNFPIFFSPHDPKVLYTTSNQFHRSTNGGQTWETFSPDLTRNAKEKLGPSGGPITKDNTSVEYYSTIFAATESPMKKGVLWAGSDDGLVHVSVDNGRTWENVTPKDLPEWIQINSMEGHPFEEGGLYLAATSYKNGDFAPYLYKTTDYGKSWTKIVNGIDAQHFTRVVRADPAKKGILYAGTETGMYISFNDGGSWQPFQLNLPIVPITDLTIKNNNLIAATQGRSFWIIDDLTVIHQLSENIGNKPFHLFKPQDSYRLDGVRRESKTAGTNRPGGVLVYYHLKEEPKEEVRLEFYDSQKNLIKEFSSKGIEKDTLKYKTGSNEFNWNLRIPDAKGFEGMIMWSGPLRGPKVVPGDYLVRLIVDGQSQDQRFKVLPDLRYESTQEDLEAQYDFLLKVRDKLTETHETITLIRKYKAELDTIVQKNPRQKRRIEPVVNAISDIEKELYQTQNRSGQDPLNFPIRLNNKLAHLNSIVGTGEFRPTDGAEEVRAELTRQIDIQLTKFREIEKSQISKILNIEEMKAEIEKK